MEREETGKKVECTRDSSENCLYLPSDSFGDLDAQEGFTAFTQFCTFCHKPKTVKVHIGTANDSDEVILSANEVVIQDISFETGQRQSSSGFCDGPSFWKGNI
jgi:hypothetical protein